MIENFSHINWEEFHFLRPMFLWLLIPILVILILGLFSLRDSVRWKGLIAPHLRRYVIRKGSEGRLRWMHLSLFASLSIAIIGTAGPTWNEIELPGKTVESSVVIALDLSQSMMATDLQPNRLGRAKFKITDFLNAGPRARTALVGFAGTAHTIVPLTEDYSIIKSHIDGLSPDIMPLPGTNLREALDLADTLTTRITAPATLLLFSDDFTEESFSILQDYSMNSTIRIEIIPMNTPSGAEVPYPNSSRPMHDSENKVVYSSLNNEVLNKLSSLENVSIHIPTLDNSDMELLAENIRSTLEFQEEDEEKEDDWKDMGLWLVIPFAFILLLSFRKGWVIYIFIGTIALTSCNTETIFIDFWLTEDFQGQQHYDKEEFNQAAEQFEDPFRKGVAYYKAENYELAIESFRNDSSAEAAFNLGLAYYQNGDYFAASRAFKKAAEADPKLAHTQEYISEMNRLADEQIETSMKQAEEAAPQEQAENIQNRDPEDLGGGGQEATEEDMERERKEETVSTDITKGQELEEVPEDLESGSTDPSQKVLMRKVDDDPALFLKRKFAYQLKNRKDKPEPVKEKW